MHITNYFGIGEEDYKYSAHVHVDLDELLAIDTVLRHEKKELDLEVYKLNTFTGKWEEINQDDAEFYEKELEERVTVVMNEHYDKYDYYVAAEESRLGV